MNHSHEDGPVEPAAHAPEPEPTSIEDPLAPLDEPTGGDEPAPGVRRTWLIVASAGGAVVALALVALFLQQADANRRVGLLVERVRELDRTVTDANEALDERVEALEDKVAAQLDVAAIARAVRPSVVTIETENALGSGWVYRASGSTSLLITNHHVIAEVGEGGRVRVRQRGLRTVFGRVVSVDPENDLATVRVRARYAALPVTERTPKAGDPVVVVGSPLGLAGTVTTGVFSGRRGDLLQFSAAVSPGNSGGPVVNSRGEVIGVAVLKITGFGAEGLSFAVPVSRICSTLISC